MQRHGAMVATLISLKLVEYLLCLRQRCNKITESNMQQNNQEWEEWGTAIRLGDRGFHTRNHINVIYEYG